MKVVAPMTVTDAVLISSNAPENDYAAWSAGTSYTVGQRVIRATTHKVYENLIAGTNVNLPENDSTRWLDLGATNRWKMFDTKVGTSTTLPSPLTWTLAPGRVDSLCLLELVGTQVQVTVTAGAGGPTIYDKTFSLIKPSVVVDWYAYYFLNDPITISQLIITDLPPNPTARVTVTVTGPSAVACGVCVTGSAKYLGATQYDASAGLNDFSVKTTDTFGATSVLKRDFSKRFEVKLEVPNDVIDQVTALIYSLRSTLAMWIAPDYRRDTFTPLIVYGFYKEFSLSIPYYDQSICSLSIEGVT